MKTALAKAGLNNQPSQIAYWLIANSGGRANAIIGEEADSPSSIAYLQNALPISKQDCPSCKVEQWVSNVFYGGALVVAVTISALLRRRSP